MTSRSERARCKTLSYGLGAGIVAGTLGLGLFQLLSGEGPLEPDDTRSSAFSATQRRAAATPAPRLRVAPSASQAPDPSNRAAAAAPRPAPRPSPAATTGAARPRVPDARQASPEFRAARTVERAFERLWRETEVLRLARGSCSEPKYRALAAASAAQVLGLRPDARLGFERSAARMILDMERARRSRDSAVRRLLQSASLGRPAPPSEARRIYARYQADLKHAKDEIRPFLSRGDPVHTEFLAHVDAWTDHLAGRRLHR